MWGQRAVKLGQPGCIGNRSKLRGERCMKNGYSKILGHRGAFHERSAQFLRNLARQRILIIALRLDARLAGTTVPKPQGERMSKKFQISKIAGESCALRQCSASRPQQRRHRHPRLRRSRALNLLLGAQGETGCASAGQGQDGDRERRETHITPDEAKELFGLVDQLLKFSSQETGLPIKSDVKRQMTTREEVEKLSDRKIQR